MQIHILSSAARAVVPACLFSVSLLLTGCNDGPNSSGDSMAEVSSVEGSLENAINDDPINADRVTLVVYGMSCPLCATNVDKQLLAVDGVKHVDVNLNSGQIDVSLASAPKPTTRQLAGAIMKSGFTLMDIKAN